MRYIWLTLSLANWNVNANWWIFSLANRMNIDIDRFILQLVLADIKFGDEVKTTTPPN